MATLKDFRDERLRKLQQLQELGVNPYPAKATRTHKAGQITKDFDALQGQSVTVVGRIKSLRKFGKIAFVVLRDDSGSVQLFWRADDSATPEYSQGELGIKDIPLLDTGDFIECSGTVIKTQTGEISVQVSRLRLLTKALRPLPSTQEGFTDKEERMRRRYVDTNVNQDVYDRFLRRSKFWAACRDFLVARGFVEINIPVLELTTGGADANPFVTHMDALDQDFYLRISHELPLKRLLVAGYEKVFDIGPRFRNENYSDEHLPEHVAIEWYWAYADWQDGMQLTQEWVRYIADQTWGKRQFTLLNGQQVDLGPDGHDWPRLSFIQLIKDSYGLDVFDCTLAQAVEQLKKIGGEVEKIDNKARVIDKLWKKIRVNLTGPAFLIDVPAFLQPLAKLQPHDTRLTEQFNLILGGTEACKAYSELNDPVDQYNRFIEQQQMRDAGDDEAQMMDIDYVEALEYGMPPACGYGHSERLFWMLEAVTAREGVIFPALRREESAVTKSLYPEAKLELPKSTGAAHKPAKQLPVSAAEQGTRKLYLDDYALLACDAKVVSSEQLDETLYRIILDQTCLYPGGGGQACDLGTINWTDGSLQLTEVSKDKDGIVYHEGTLTGAEPMAGSSVKCTVDTDRRFINSQLHCAGHLLDKALDDLGYNWKSGKSAHYPHMSFVDYDTADFDPTKAEQIARDIENKLDEYSQNGGHIGVIRVPSNEAKNYSDYIPDAVLRLFQNVHIATYPDGFNICCGGTHLNDVNELSHVTIIKVKKKDGAVRVSYQI